jgi:hypothetical protein
MSICQQAIASRRKARRDTRYKGLKLGDAGVSRRRLEAKVRREYERSMRKHRK